MSSASWFAFYPGDHLRDTQHLSGAEGGAYHWLTVAYYASGKPLRDDDATLARIARFSLKEWQAMRPTIALFFEIGDGVWRHKRIELELAETGRRTRAGKVGAAARWGPKITVVK